MLYPAELRGHKRTAPRQPKANRRSSETYVSRCIAAIAAMVRITSFTAFFGGVARAPTQAFRKGWVAPGSAKSNYDPRSQIREPGCARPQHTSLRLCAIASKYLAILSKVDVGCVSRYETRVGCAVVCGASVFA